MSLQRILAIALRQFYLLRGSPARIVPLFAWVAVDVVLWGFITRYLTGFSGSTEVDWVASVLGAVLLWNFLTRVMQGVTMAFFEDVWSRNFLNLFAAPLSVAEYVSGLVLSSIATSSLGLGVMLAVAGGVFGLTLGWYGILLVPFLMVLFFSGIALGVFGSAVVLRLGPAAEWLIWPMPALLSPFACVFYPRATLPVWMQGVSYLVPPSYVFEGMRALVNGGPFSGFLLLTGLALGLLYLVLACAFFTLTYQRVVRSGGLARYTAESVS